MRSFAKLFAAAGSVGALVLGACGGLIMSPDIPMASAAPLSSERGDSLFSCEGESTYSLHSLGSIVNTRTGEVIAPTIQQNPYQPPIPLPYYGPGGYRYFNALGITKDGSAAYAVMRDNVDSSRQWALVYKFDAQAGWTLASDSWISTNGNLVAGAVDPVTNKYFFGGFSDPDSNGITEFEIYEFDPDTSGAVKRGFIRVPALSDWNGDMAFDARGNLFVIQGDRTRTALYSISRKDISQGPEGGEITDFSTFTLGHSLADMDGIAFMESGNVDVGNLRTVAAFSQVVWKRIPDTERALTSSTDLASCITPPTITIKKYAPNGLYDASDAFKMQMFQDGSEVSTVTASTYLNNPASDGDGLMGNIMGPVPVSRGITLSFTESAGTKTTDLRRYNTTWSCSVDGNPIDGASGTGTAGEITIPDDGEQIECKFVNAPKRGSFKVAKTVDGTADAGLTYSGSWTCTEPEPAADPTNVKTVTGTWEVKAGEVWTSPTDSIPLGYECAVTEDSPTGPVASDPSWQWDGSPTIGQPVAAAEEPATITVVNRSVQHLGTAIWKKASSEASSSNEEGSEQLLDGSSWELTHPDGSKVVVEDCVAADAAGCAGKNDQDPVAGQFKLVDLKWGTYQLVEKTAPFGYILDSTPRSFEVGQTSPATLSIDLGTIRNTPVATPTIPLSAGFGSELYAISGAAVVGVGLLISLVGARRNRRAPNPTYVKTENQ